MDLQLQGKRAVVTGGSRGIGLAVARVLAAEGVDVAIAARGEAALQAAARDLAGSGRRILPVVVDTRDADSVDAMVRTTVRELGGVDILVNAAARPSGNGLPVDSTVSDEEFRGEIEVKVLGYLRCVRSVAPHMTAQGWGRIVSISGLNARRAGSLVGSVRNVAVAAMTKNLADELGPQGVNVTVVHPGLTVTERLPVLLESRATARGVTPADVERGLAAETSIGRLVTAEEVADVVAFLASPRSVAVTGDAVAVGGGSRGAIHY